MAVFPTKTALLTTPSSFGRRAGNVSSCCRTSRCAISSSFSVRTFCIFFRVSPSAAVWILLITSAPKAAWGLVSVRAPRRIPLLKSHNIPASVVVPTSKEIPQSPLPKASPWDLDRPSGQFSRKISVPASGSISNPSGKCSLICLLVFNLLKSLSPPEDCFF